MQLPNEINLENGNRGPWIETFSGRLYYLLDPRPQDIVLADIAHSLARICRFTGHCRTFYSVAEHCVRCYFQAVREYPDHPSVLRWALLHDAHEAYTGGDIASPVKTLLGDRYFNMVRMADGAISQKFKTRHLVHDVAEIVKEIDLRMLITERNELMGPPVQPWRHELEPYPFIHGVSLGWDPHKAEAEFLDVAHNLGMEDES